MREALAKSKRVGIAKVVLKSREHLAAVKPVRNMITLEMMRFGHEIVDPKDLNLPGKIDISEKEMGLANMLIDSMADKFDPEKYKDEYHDKVLEVIQAKIEGVAPKVPTGRPKAPSKVVDLMEVLKESLKEKQTQKKTSRTSESETRSRKVR